MKPIVVRMVGLVVRRVGIAGVEVAHLAAAPPTAFFLRRR
jgi:hypothetical protein